MPMLWTQGPKHMSEALGRERTAFQVAVGVASVVPVTTGLLNMTVGLRGVPGSGGSPTPSADSEFRFANAFWFATGPLLWAAVPDIERKTVLLRGVVGAIFLGGVARLLGWRHAGRPHPIIIAGVATELVVGPLLLLWHRRFTSQSPTT